MRFLSYFFTLFGVISFIFILFSVKLIEEIVHPNIKSNELSYEYIVVLSGNVNRVVKASELFTTKNASYILLSKEDRLIENQVSESESVSVYQYYIEVLVSKGIERNNIILFGDNKNTRDEIISLSKILKTKSFKMLLVTDSYHINRVQKLLIQFDLSDKIDLYPIEVNPDGKISKRALQNYILEYFKLLNFYLTRFNINIIQYN